MRLCYSCVLLACELSNSFWVLVLVSHRLGGFSVRSSPPRIAVPNVPRSIRAVRTTKYDHVPKPDATTGSPGNARTRFVGPKTSGLRDRWSPPPGWNRLERVEPDSTASPQDPPSGGGDRKRVPAWGARSAVRTCVGGIEENERSRSDVNICMFVKLHNFKSSSSIQTS